MQQRSPPASLFSHQKVPFYRPLLTITPEQRANGRLDRRMEQRVNLEKLQIFPNKLVDFKNHTYYISIDDLNGPITQNSCKFVRLREEVDANNSTKKYYFFGPFSPFEKRIVLPKEFWTKERVIIMTFSIHRMTTNCKRAHETM